MRKRKEDLEKESNNLSIIVVLSLFLICSLGYIAYDKYFTNISQGEEKSTDCVTDVAKTDFNKDGYFIQDLMDSIIYKSYIDHLEYQLYGKDKVTVEDLSEYYKNNLIGRQLHREVFSVEKFNNTSMKLFGKKVYTSMPDEIEMLCRVYGLDGSGSYYSILPATGGCGGSGYRYYDKITKVDSDEDHIYVFQKVGFSCDEGVCKTLVKTDNGYEAKEVVKELSNLSDSVNMDDLAKDLNEYKFTFTYDKGNNIYYFESVEKVTE